MRCNQSNRSIDSKYKNNSFLSRSLNLKISIVPQAGTKFLLVNDTVPLSGNIQMRVRGKN